MKKCLIFLLTFMLCGCAVYGGTLRELDGVKLQLAKASDSLIYHEAQLYQNNLMENDYAVQIEQSSGPVMTLLFEDNQCSQIIVHAEEHTKWIEIFEDRVMCFTGNKGEVAVELLHDLSFLGDVETIVKCASDPVSLAFERKFQKVSGAEEGSLQIATDNIDFWMKVSSHQKMEQVRLYFSTLPMMTMTYSNDLPLFPNITLEDYPAYFDVMTVNETILAEKGFVKSEDKFVLSDEKTTEEISLSDFRMDYARKEENQTIRLIYDQLTLTGIHTDHKTHDYCEVVLEGERMVPDEIRCDKQREKECLNLFEELKKRFK